MIEIYELPDGRWGYKVESVVQEWMPDVDGHVPMTKEEAETNAKIVAERLGIVINE